MAHPVTVSVQFTLHAPDDTIFGPALNFPPIGVGEAVAMDRPLLVLNGETVGHITRRTVVGAGKAIVIEGVITRPGFLTGLDSLAGYKVSS